MTKNSVIILTVTLVLVWLVILTAMDSVSKAPIAVGGIILGWYLHKMSLKFNKAD
ncbi:MAG: hypothetical protein J6I62_01495 [Selenomonadaceae bacterium]|nr:hypothetical protein [Selenomonadaceae bacterium]